MDVLGTAGVKGCGSSNLGFYVRKKAEGCCEIQRRDVRA